MGKQHAAKAPQGQVVKVTCPSCAQPIPEGSESDERCAMCGGLLSGEGAPNLLPEVVKKITRPQSLNPGQHDAVYADGNLLITACPGSGKTFVLRERAIRKLKQHPDELGVAVTFTKDAAQEIEHRILAAFPEAGGRMTCGTFHSLCKRQLEAANIQVHLVNDFKRTELIVRAIKELSPSLDVAEAIAYIDKIKTQLHPSIDLTGENRSFGVVYLRYQELLSQLDAMDFSDMIIKTTQMMETGRVEPLNCTFLMVDEAQDSDPIQWAWVKAHIDKGIEVTAVGDDDQSIYSWRNCSGISGLLSYMANANASHVSLGTTYRCAHEIVVPAGKLIEHNKERMPKVLRTENLDQGTVNVIQYESEQAELNEMVNIISRSGIASDWGILVRTNRQAEKVEAAVGALIDERKFEVSRKSGASFWDLAESATLLALCKSLVFDEMVGVDTVLSMAGLGESNLRRLHKRYPPRKKGSLSDFLRETPHQSSRTTGIEGHFAKLASQWRMMLSRGNTEMPLEAMKAYVLEGYRFGMGVSPGSAKYARADRILSAAARSISSADGSAKAISNRLRNISNEQTQEGDQIDRKAAKLLTMHSSKGLEFKNVWIFAANASKDEMDGTDVEEERRLFYVAMTRAKSRLYITHSETPTRFIAEAGL